MNEVPKPSVPEAEESLEKDPHPASVVVWACFRVVLLLWGLCSVAMGIFFIAISIQEKGWWMLALGLPLLAYGSWVIWNSLLGKRRSVDKIVTGLLTDLLSKLF